MPITIDGNGTIGGASTLSTTVASPTFTTPNINSAQFATVTGTAPLYAARAWVNFNGTGTVAIRASGNVSSITDNGTGQYVVNFTTAMPATNYSACITVGTNSGGFGTQVATTVYNTASLSMIVLDRFGNIVVDTEFVNVAIFR